MNEKLKRRLLRILLAGAVFAVIFAADHRGMAPAVFGNIWIRALLYVIPWLLSGADVLKKAVLGIIHGQVMDESFLMTLASVGAFVTGECGEAAAVMLFYQVGEWFQSYAVGQSRRSISELMEIAPESATIEREDGTVEKVDPDDVLPGDVLVIPPGEKIPVDGEVLLGESFVQTAALTGESVPRYVSPGDPVISGCVNGEGLLKVKALKAYEESTVAKILELVEEASEKKSRIENFITRFARLYTPAVVCAAVILAVVPSLMTGRWMIWLYRACTFLVISCPCALVISVPLAFFGGVGAASRAGVLVKGSNYLELLARIGTLAADKTGTLTEGRFQVRGVYPSAGVTEEELLSAAACAESLSTHPIALSVLGEARRRGIVLKSGMAENTEAVPGKGLTAKVSGVSYCVGTPSLLADRGISVPPCDNGAATVCCVAADGKYLGTILICDEVKEGVPEAIRDLRSAGVRHIVILTGDRESAASEIAERTGADEVYAELLPADKVQRMEEILRGAEKDGCAVAFAGDGINDAPVLMRADVGIAMGSLGSDAAIEAADVVIMDDDLARIPRVIRIARKTVRIAKQNIVFALAVKLVILILGAAGAANMWAAVFADVGVAVLCILNSMRLLGASRLS